MPINYRDFGFSENQWQELIKIFSSAAKIKEVILFGSRAMGNFKSASDVDIAINGDLTGAEMSEIRGAFEESQIPFFFDIINLSEINSPELLMHIQKKGIKIFPINH